ncbi:MAG TPA: alpha/beta hydrolase [Planctomycetota bacterium]|nr:alpha/beta hydrolase [Planctomycetota bacterium]
MKRASVGTLRVVYDDVGPGEPALLLLPGWCEPRTGFGPLLERAAPRRRTISFDWRGHGESDRPGADFGAADLVENALAVLEASGVRRIVPVSISHAGWIALELRRRLGAGVERLVLLDWIVPDPPPSFLAALEGLREPRRWEETRSRLFSMWLGGSVDPALVRHVRSEMGAHPFEMWARAAREIAAAYAREGRPLATLSELSPPLPTLHLYAQPTEAGYLDAQESFASRNPWIRVTRLEGKTHFPVLETPDAVAEAIEAFLS